MSSDARPPIPTGASKARVHQFAEEIARRVGLQPGGALEPVVSRLNGRLIHHSPFSIESAAPPAIIVQRDSSFEIHLPSTTSPQRNRFTIAHEIGHLLLHFPMVQKDFPHASMIATRWVDESNESLRRAEWEANWFAAAFLMPSGAFRERASALRNRLSAVAEEFDVSEQAARIRGESIGLTLS